MAARFRHLARRHRGDRGVEQAITGAGLAIGTLPYMAPEQLAAQPIGGRHGCLRARGRALRDCSLDAGRTRGFTLPALGIEQQAASAIASRTRRRRCRPGAALDGARSGCSSNGSRVRRLACVDGCAAPVATGAVTAPSSWRQLRPPRPLSRLSGSGRSTGALASRGYPVLVADRRARGDGAPCAGTVCATPASGRSRSDPATTPRPTRPPPSPHQPRPVRLRGQQRPPRSLRGPAPPAPPPPPRSQHRRPITGMHTATHHAPPPLAIIITGTTAPGIIAAVIVPLLARFLCTATARTRWHC